MKEMTSRERVLAAIKHEQPDRIPIDLGSTPSSGISAIAYHNLKKYLGITSGHVRVYDVVQQLAQPEDELISRFSVDVLDVGRTFNTRDEDWYDVNLFDGTPVQFPSRFRPELAEDGSLNAYHEDGTLVAKMPKDGYFFDQTCFPYVDGYPQDYSDLPDAMGKVLWATLVHSPWDNADDPAFWTKLRENAKDLRKKTDKALLIVVGCNLFEWGTFLRRMDKFLVDLMRNPRGVNDLLDALMETHLSILEKACKSVGDIVDILRFGDDLGENKGPFMSPKLYRKFFKGRHQELCTYVHKHSKMHTFLHTCGSIMPLIPDLIDVGYEIINPVQVNAEGMDPKILKEKYGHEVTFWGGGADTRNVLNRKTPEEVKHHVTGLLEIFSPGGGYVFNSIHNILPDVPPENIVAMFEAVNEFDPK
ncbi:MAG: uroporphyrinogen decarboxylase family protein [Candidatus Hodarchaeota archaeon]